MRGLLVPEALVEQDSLGLLAGVPTGLVLVFVAVDAGTPNVLNCDLRADCTFSKVAFSG